MARAAQPEYRKSLEDMATTWEQLAEVRRKDLARRGEPED